MSESSSGREGLSHGWRVSFCWLGMLVHHFVKLAEGHQVIVENLKSHMAAFPKVFIAGISLASRPSKQPLSEGTRAAVTCLFRAVLHRREAVAPSSQNPVKSPVTAKLKLKKLELLPVELEGVLELISSNPFDFQLRNQIQRCLRTCSR